MVRTSAMPSGSRLILVRMKSGIWNASARGRIRTRTSCLLHFAIHLGLDLVDQLTAQRFKFKSIRPWSGSMLPPVTRAP